VTRKDVKGIDAETDAESDSRPYGGHNLPGASRIPVMQDNVLLSTDKRITLFRCEQVQVFVIDQHVWGWVVNR
jgi:hypothetical protein